MKKVIYLFLFIWLFNQSYAKLPNHPTFSSNSKTSFDIEDELISEELIERLSVLCKVWGFVKYHHPEVAEGKWDMDEELIELIPLIENAENKEEYLQILSEWVDKIGEITEFIEPQYPPEEDIHVMPDYSWLETEILGLKLKDQIENIKKTERGLDHYYLDFYKTINPRSTFKNEKEYAEMLYPDKDYRLLCLFRYWNMVQYFFPYRHLMDQDWNITLEEFIPKFILAENEYEYKYNVQALIVSINDSHALILFYDAVSNKVKGIGTYSANLDVRFIEDKAVVTGYNNSLSLPTGKLRIGDIIESVDGKPVENIIKERLPVTSGSNYEQQLYIIAMYLLTSDNRSITVRYIRDGESYEHDITLSNYTLSPKKHYFNMIDDDIAYIYAGTLYDQHVNEIMPTVMDTKGLILDLRNYPKNTNYTLGNFLMPEPITFAEYTYTLFYPGLFSFNSQYQFQIGTYNPDYYKGKVIIIVNEESQSQSEFTAMGWRMAPNATVIGTTTSGADGDITEFYLPGNILTGFSGFGIYNPDRSETQRVGIIPDIYVYRTIEGVKNGTDEQLEKAIELINQTTDLRDITDSSIYIYPNPAKDFIIIEGLNKACEFEIIDLYGRTYSSGSINNNETIDISSLSIGIYLLKIKSNGIEYYKQKIIKE